MGMDRDQKRFELWLVQIERFAAKGNEFEAIARARELVREGSALLAARPGELGIEAAVARARERLAALEREFEAKNRAVRERRLGDLARPREGG